MLLKNVLVVSIASENSFIIHNIKSLTTSFFLWNGWEKHTIFSTSILMFAAYNLRLSTFETLGHIKFKINYVC